MFHYNHKRVEKLECRVAQLEAELKRALAVIEEMKKEPCSHTGRQETFIEREIPVPDPVSSRHSPHIGLLLAAGATGTAGGILGSAIFNDIEEKERDALDFEIESDDAGEPLDEELEDSDVD